MLARWWIAFAAFTVVCAAIAATIAAKSNAGFKDAASVLSFAGLVAVGIERILEFIWTLVGQAKSAGGWWPLSRALEEATKVETQTNVLLTGVFDQVQKGLEAAQAVAKGDEEALAVIKGQLDKLPAVRKALSDRLAAAQTLAPGSSRLAMAADVRARAFMFLDATDGMPDKETAAVQKALQEASSAASVALAVVGAFQDNPARRIASILIGSGLGMLVTGFMGLNVFAATLSTDAGVLAGVSGIVLTGVFVGLGSNPTHEAIKALQQLKESGQKTTAADPTSMDASADAGVVETLGFRPQIISARQSVRGGAPPGDRVTIRTTD